MSKIKAINDSSDMVAIFHTSDTEIKKNLFLDLISNWMTIEEIEKSMARKEKGTILSREDKTC
jgi:Uncharacterized protein conserved in archaea